MPTITLYRPVGPQELALIEQSAWTVFPPRLPDQPIFYPVTNEEYATQIARDWNVKASGAGFVTRFEVEAEYASRFPRKIVGSRIHEELWVPAEELAGFNAKIVGKIEVIRSFGAENPDAGVSGVSRSATAGLPGMRCVLASRLMSEIIFEVREDEVDGGYNASALGVGIHTQGDTLDELRANVREAVNCYFDEKMEAPKIIRLHYVRDEVLTR